MLLPDWLPVGVHVTQGLGLDITQGAVHGRNVMDACTRHGEPIVLSGYALTTSGQKCMDCISSSF